MAILNYTTKIAAGVTAAEVSSALVKARARRVSIEYDDQGEPSGLGFTVETPYGARDFALPARVEGVFAALKEIPAAQLKASRVTPSEQQARKVAWRILKDWTEAQLALIEASMTTLDEVMLPYMVGAADGRTVYAVYRDQQLAIGAGS